MANSQAISPEERFFSSDQPIAGRADDRLGRRAFAEALARQIATAPSETSFVVGLTGAWGSGKTSILNMVKEALDAEEGIVVLPFNPWLFSGTEQLVTAFFAELGAELFKRPDERLRKIGELLEAYGQAVSPLTFVPVVGPWAGRMGAVAKAGGRLLNRQPKGISAQDQRERIIAALKEVDRRFVIVLDDIDRLRPDEILHVMKLVKLAADFPRVVYLLAFDRHRVEEALQEGSGPGSDRGRNYLEKIVQVIHDVPVARQIDVFQLLVNELAELIELVPHGPLKDEDWQNVSRFVMMPLFQNIRDVRRYMNSLPVALQSLGDEVALVDVLALEAVRVLMPDVFEALAANSGILTDTSPAAVQAAIPEDQQTRTRLENLINQAGERRALLEAVCRWLFPTTQRVLSNQGFGAEMVRSWRRDRRVGHPSVLRFYLERSLPPNVLPVARVQALVDALNDEARLSELVSPLSPPELENALGRLGDFRDEFTADLAEPATPVFMNQLPRLREGTLYPEDFGPVQALGMLIHFFFRAIDDPTERMRVAEAIMPRLATLSARLVLLRWIGHEDEGEPGLISKEDEARLAETLQRQIFEATDESLASERNLGELLDWAVKTSGEQATTRARQVAENDAVMLRVLRSFLREVHARTLGHAAFTTQYWLPWDEILVNIFGTQYLEARVARLSAEVAPESVDERTRGALEVASRYITGWRPAQLPRHRRRNRQVRNEPPRRLNESSVA